MEKSELKKVLKPLIKECIKEVLMEEAGVLSHVIKEVATGMGSQPARLNEKKEESKQDAVFVQRTNSTNSRVLAARQELAESMRRKGLGDILEGVTPLGFAGIPQEDGGGASATMAGALADTDPNDEGIDISFLGFNK